MIRSSHTNPAGPWEFDEKVADCFPDMLRRSTPGYEAMRRVTLDLAADNLAPGPVLNLGASRGDAVAELIERGDGHEWHLVEVSPPCFRCSGVGSETGGAW